MTSVFKSFLVLFIKYYITDIHFIGWIMYWLMVSLPILSNTLISRLAISLMVDTWSSLDSLGLATSSSSFNGIWNISRSLSAPVHILMHFFLALIIVPCTSGYIFFHLIKLRNFSRVVVYALCQCFILSNVCSITSYWHFISPRRSINFATYSL